MIQEDLFDLAVANQKQLDQLLIEIQKIANKVVCEMEYPKGCIGIAANKTKSETNYILQIRELRRSASSFQANDASVVAEDMDGVRKNFTCSTILTMAFMKPRSKYSSCVELRMSVPTFCAVRIPSAEIVKERWGKVGKSNSSADDAEGGVGSSSVQEKRVLLEYRVCIRLDSADLLPYFEKIMRNRLANYKSTEPSFGCCHLYNECSDARRCISKDKMYATVCSYRKNLESGRIFYGKNATI